MENDEAMKYKQESLAYWGAGDYGKLCIESYPDIRPDFFIDSNRGGENWCGIPVKRPDEIEDWKEVFVVITAAAIPQIEAVLNGKNLERNKDYARYKDFFEIPQENFEQKVAKVKAFVEEHKEYKGSIFIDAPVFVSRVSDELIRFFREYGIRRKPQKCVLVTDLQVVREDVAEKIMGYPVFDFSEICYWNGVLNPSARLDKSKLTHESSLTEEEREWIRLLEKRKFCEDEELSYKVTVEIYWYFKSVLLEIQPSKVIIWSGWERQSNILAKISEEMGIPYGYLEHGWIAGTVQFDKYWVENYDKYDEEPEVEIDKSGKCEEIRQIQKYIVENKLDTGKSRKIEEDERSLRRIDLHKKTILFIGMGDAGVGVNPASDYWKRYIMPSFSSSLDAALCLAKICKKNDWNFVFKPHPNYSGKIDAEKMDNNIIFVRYTEIERLIGLADVVVSVISKVDYKVLMYKKPLIKLGCMTLYKKGCCYEISEKDEMESLIIKALETGVTKEQIRCFELHLAQLLEYHLWDDLTDREFRYGLTLEQDFFDVDFYED